MRRRQEAWSRACRAASWRRAAGGVVAGRCRCVRAGRAGRHRAVAVRAASARRDEDQDCGEPRHCLRRDHVAPRGFGDLRDVGGFARSERLAGLGRLRRGRLGGEGGERCVDEGAKHLGERLCVRRSMRSGACAEVRGHEEAGDGLGVGSLARAAVGDRLRVRPRSCVQYRRPKTVVGGAADLAALERRDEHGATELDAWRRPGCRASSWSR